MDFMEELFPFNVLGAKAKLDLTTGRLTIHNLDTNAKVVVWTGNLQNLLRKSLMPPTRLVGSYLRLLKWECQACHKDTYTQRQIRTVQEIHCAYCQETVQLPKYIEAVVAE